MCNSSRYYKTIVAIAVDEYELKEVFDSVLSWKIGKQSERCLLSLAFCQLPAPKDISDDELVRLLDAEDPSGFRIPMSLGEPHVELDKGNETSGWEQMQPA